MKREQTQTRDKTSQLQQWDIWKSSPRVNSRALCCSSGSRGQQRPNICAAGSWFHILNIHLAAVSLDPVSEHTVYVQCWTLQGKQVWAGHTCWVRPCSQRKLISADFGQPLCELLEGLSVWVNDVFEHRAGDGQMGEMLTAPGQMWQPLTVTGLNSDLQLARITALLPSALWVTYQTFLSSDWEFQSLIPERKIHQCKSSSSKLIQWE